MEEVGRQLFRQAHNLKHHRIANARLTDCERDIIEVIGDAGRRLTTGMVLKAMDRAGKTISESTVKNHLANLVRRGLLGNCPNCDPRGYGLPDWPHDCGLDSVRTD